MRTYTDIFNPGIFNPSIWVIFPLHLSVYATWWARAAKSTLQHPARAKSFITFQCQRVVCTTYVLLKYKRTALGGDRVAQRP